ncbi:hypothetical protein [Deinococcus peraridilitoris]|uniref:Uncharacterized protein n=1 Tax=Deinococcus peraridilitoris (strain DSM 19664 / LMG 22246 / CIP 109416 / KR-200) TaxID=937777 RepID=L0A9I4_DEIPD|nr:hypothetical protein [Deinococcus peraridilitoris]AFZ69792.1 hypothetical protein Deipe_4467 [Deinococcus peraridilitoris DSM 19664]
MTEVGLLSRPGSLTLSSLPTNPASPWTPEALRDLMLGLPDGGVTVGAPSLLDLLPGDEDTREQPSLTLTLHRTLPELGTVALNPGLNWSRARALLAGIAPKLGKAHRLAVALYALALGARQDEEDAVTFVVTTWELGVLCGVSADYISELLVQNKPTFSKLMYWGKSVTAAPFQKWAKQQEKARREARGRKWTEADDDRPVHFVSGLLFHVKLFDQPLTENDLAGKRVKGNEAFFQNTRRDLQGDILRGWTKRRLGEEGRLASNARGTVRGRMLQATTPDDAALEVLQYVTLRVRGLLPEDLASGVEERVLNVNDLLAALREPVVRSRSGRRDWVQKCALGFVRLLGRPGDSLHWLSICWAAVNVTGAQLGDGIEALYEAAFEVFVRSADNPNLHGGAAQSRLLRWLLKKAGFFDWREAYRGVRLAV